MPARILAGAMCVQRFDDSLKSAIHITYRISLRSSSMPEPRDPLLKVLTYCISYSERPMMTKSCGPLTGCRPGGAGAARVGATRRGNGEVGSQWLGVLQLCNDPSAGSPTETLLRLLLPLNDRVWIAFRPWVVVADLPGPVRKPH
jgi:hypothetical protein